MATSITSSFAGKATDFYLSALLESKTLATAGITIDNEVQYKYIPRGFDMSNIIVTGSTCVWSDAGNTTITESPVEVQPFHINKTECYKDYKTSWNGVAGNDGLPADVMSALEQKTADSIRDKTERDLWRSSTASETISGNTMTKNLFNGYLKTQKGTAVSVGGTVLTASNIVAELGKVYNALPDAIKSKPNDQKVIFVSFKAEGLYRQAQISMGNNTSVGDKPLDYLGIEVRGVGIFDNVISAGLRESYHVASNIALDSASINVKDMYPVTLERNARIEAEWLYTPAMSNVAQTVLYNF
jgi:hypothetical protein